MLTSLSKALVLALFATSVAAHGRVNVATGDQGGNGTGLGVQGGVIPGTGSNKVTEPDTTVFNGKAADGCGRTEGQGVNNMETGMQQAMALSGNTLPQISAGGSLSGTIHIITSDGAGPYKAMIDTTGTGQSFNQELEVTQQVPGTRGNIKKTEKRFWARALQSVGLMKRATNINEDYPFAVNIPSNVQCAGSSNGQSNLCVVKLINPSGAGPFGGCVVAQQVQAGANTSNAGTTTAAARRSRKLRA